MSSQVKISASKLAVAEQCEYRFWMKYVKRIRVDILTHPAAALGTVFHKAIELWYQSAKMNGTPLALESLKSFVRMAWDSCISARKFSLSAEYIRQNKDKMLVEVANLLEAFYQDEAGRGTMVLPMWMEKDFLIPWDTGKGFIVLLNGFMDRVTLMGNDVFITDYKTSSILKTQTEVDEDPQMTIYAAVYRWLAKKSVTGLPEAESFVELYFPKFRKHVMSVRTKDHFDDLKSRLIKAGEIELKELKNATPSEDACRFCEYATSGDCKLTPFTKRKTA